jgi:alanine dehydrogenase
MVPADALTRYSMRGGEKGPPGGPENAILGDGVTTKDAADCSAELGAAPMCVTKSTDRLSKTPDGMLRMTLIVIRN